jgi:hypothetical protein
MTAKKSVGVGQTLRAIGEDVAKLEFAEPGVPARI